MPKNVIIFSDGTGQVGGINFDEDRTNIYKMYRTCRVGPDSTINPAEQVAYYDPGIGSVADGGHLMGRMARWIYNKVSQATGLGITANIVDCYAALIRLWRPGDKIYLFGFSRGAYTVRCLASVVGMCGIPQADGQAKISLDLAASRRIARRAVKSVYQYTHSVTENRASCREKELMKQRLALAAQFRQQFKSFDPSDANKANVYPHFIGVFDTVSAIATPTSLTMLTAACVAIAAVLAGFIQTSAWAWNTPILQWVAELGYLKILGIIIVCAASAATLVFLLKSVKWTTAIPGVPWTKTVHRVQLKQQFKDLDLNPNAGYARHAISIDERRASFARVAWGFKYDDKKHDSLDEHGNSWFQQLWFAGNHADIGGGYPENESRLSDCALTWMVDEARKIGLKVDDRVLQLHGSCDGMQHDEVAAGFPVVTALTGLTWWRRVRLLPSADAPLHESVYERFKCRDVLQYSVYSPYRPSNLASHSDLGGFYGGVTARAEDAVSYEDSMALRPSKEQPAHQSISSR